MRYENLYCDVSQPGLQQPLSRPAGISRAWNEMQGENENYLKPDYGYNDKYPSDQGKAS
jgi:hypothetical protein